MDIKIIFLLLIVIVILLFVTREILSIKKEFNKQLNNNDEINKLVKNKLNSITTDIKNYNNDLLAQAKKINKINSQMITSMSNYYTETDSDNKNLLEYLSDVKNNDEFKINFSPDKFNLKTSETELSTISKTTQNEDEVILSLNTKYKSDLSQLNNNGISNNSDLSNNLINHNNSDVSNNFSLVDDNISLESSHLSNNNNNNLNNNIVNKNILQEKALSLDSLSDVESEDNIINVDNLDNHDNLDNLDNNKINNNKDTKSVDTNIFANITRLNPVTSYTKQELDKIAKTLSIPLTYIDGSQRKTYKKEELYSKINEVLNKKSNQ